MLWLLIFGIFFADCLSQQVGFNSENRTVRFLREPLLTAPIVDKTLSFILLTVVLFLGAAVPSSYADVPDAQVMYAPSVRVNCCHLMPRIETRKSHSPTRVCHQSAPQPRDLNLPEYRQGQQLAYQLIKEPRTPDPQSNAGQSFVIPPAPETRLHSPAKVSRASRQSQICLRSDVLLH